MLREEVGLPRASPACTSAGTCIICLHEAGLRHVLGLSALCFGTTRAAAAVPARRLLSTVASNQASIEGIARSRRSRQRYASRQRYRHASSARGRGPYEGGNPDRVIEPYGTGGGGRAYVGNLKEDALRDSGLLSHPARRARRTRWRCRREASSRPQAAKSGIVEQFFP
eukprot:scaffold88123_cov67-Phaeocystis_antarctica.AAC.2